MKSTANIKQILAIVVAMIFGLTAWCEDATVDGLQFSYDTSGNTYLRKAVAGVPSEVVVPAAVEFEKGGLRAINQWYDCAFDARENSATHELGVCKDVISVKSEDSDGQLYIYGKCFISLPKLKTIELPAQLTKIDCDLIIDCPSLESLTLRSTQVIEILSAYSSTSTQGTYKTLYVQPELVDTYKNMAANGTKDEMFFLSQFEEIRSIDQGGEDVEAGVHVLFNDLHMNLRDARPGDRLTIIAHPDSMLNHINVNGNVHDYQDVRQDVVTLPEFEHHMVLAIETVAPGMSTHPAIATEPTAGRVHSTAHGYRIEGYDGTPVTVINLAGRIVRRTHKSSDTLPQGIYILFYNNKGHKIVVKE